MNDNNQAAEVKPKVFLFKGIVCMVLATVFTLFVFETAGLGATLLYSVLAILCVLLSANGFNKYVKTRRDKLRVERADTHCAYCGKYADSGIARHMIKGGMFFCRPCDIAVAEIRAANPYLWAEALSEMTIEEIGAAVELCKSADAIMDSARRSELMRASEEERRLEEIHRSLTRRSIFDRLDSLLTFVAGVIAIGLIIGWILYEIGY